jgi:predicted SprT family Zn-dependent metalloprotease
MIKVGDRVMYVKHGTPHIGVIWQKHRTKCHVFVRSLKTSVVMPYKKLHYLEDNEVRYITDLPIEKEGWGYTNLRIIEEMGRKLLVEHNLPQWSFQFDWAHTRTGVCFHNIKTIGVSVRYCMKYSLDEVRLTILHEIAHAIAGYKHQHDDTWREISYQIGATGKRTHHKQFSAPKYIRFCPNLHWVSIAQRRMRNRICRECHATVTYEPYSEERYKELRDVCIKK